MKGIGGFFNIPAAGGAFFFCSWLTMLFWGIIGPWIGLRTVSYPEAMVMTIALWLITAPLMAVVGAKGMHRAMWRVSQ
ncbi:MAG: hypothetical protein EXR49_04175 [Dehalococcoidia bacterium]|nr:hypothetical protein [Dehalococcoidia bacterium]